MNITRRKFNSIAKDLKFFKGRKSNYKSGNTESSFRKQIHTQLSPNKTRNDRQTLISKLQTKYSSHFFTQQAELEYSPPRGLRRFMNSLDGNSDFKKRTTKKSDGVRSSIKKKRSVVSSSDQLINFSRRKRDLEKKHTIAFSNKLCPLFGGTDVGEKVVITEPLEEVSRKRTSKSKKQNRFGFSTNILRDFIFTDKTKFKHKIE